VAARPFCSSIEIQKPSGARLTLRAASRALLAGESVDEVAFLLGHRDATVTRTVYVREIADARRRSMRRSRMVVEYGGVLRTALSSRKDGRPTAE
jgi:integrase